MIGLCSRQLRFLFQIFILYACLTIGTATANEISANPFVKIGSEYNDNLFNSAEAKTDDVISNVSPGIELIKSDERWNAFLSAEAAFKAYSENSELNNIDKNFLSSLKGRLSERMLLSLNAGFTADSRNDRDFEETGMIDGEFTLRTEKVIRKDTDLGASASYDLSETTSTTLGYNFTINEFDDREYADYDSHNMSLRLNRDLSGPLPEMEIFAQTDYDRYKSIEKPLMHPVYGENYKKEIKINSMSGLAGFNASLNENLRIRIQFGGRYDNIRYLSWVSGSKVPETEKKGWGQLGEINLTHNGEKNVWDISLRHDIRPKTGSGFFVKNTAARIRTTHMFTENLHTGIRAGYYLNKSYDSLDSDQIDEETIRLQPNIIYFLTKEISIECKYDYSHLKDRQNKTYIERNRIMLGISLIYPVNKQ